MTAQIDVWRGDFGRDYITRNEATASNTRDLTRMWARMLQNIRPLSALEVGANIGNNIRAIRNVMAPHFTAVEPNELARQRLKALNVRVVDADAERLPFDNGSFDLAFTSGVLIHIPPENLAAACQELCRVSSRYVLCVEYFSQEPREVRYRDSERMLWTRDFGQFYLDTCPELKCIDYGFFWTGAGAVDNLTFWLFEK